MLLGKIVPCVGLGNTAPSIHLLILALYKTFACLHHMLPHLSFFFNFWVTVCKTVRPVLSDHCLSVCPVLSVCNIGVLCPNDWMDWDETWHGGRPRHWPHCIRWGPSSPPQKGHSPPIFGPCLLWPLLTATSPIADWFSPLCHRESQQ